MCQRETDTLQFPLVGIHMQSTRNTHRSLETASGPEAEIRL